MKKTKRVLKTGVFTALACVLAFGVVGCGEGTNNPNPPQPPAPTITMQIEDAVSTISAGDTVKLVVKIENTEEKGVTWSSSDPTILKVDEDGTVSVVKAPDLLDKAVTITATSKADSRVTAAKTFIVKAPKQEGKNGLLTSEMIEKIGNASITVDGKVTDHYYDSNNPENNYTRDYAMNVEMEDGKWMGAWGANDKITVSDIYQRGDQDGVKDDYGNTGHAILSVMIDKNNEVVKKPVTNYRSVPSVWESQHYWNHLGSLPLNDFTYKESTEEGVVSTEYTYRINEENEDSVWLMTYLAYSLTPMLEDTFDRVILLLEQDAEGNYFVGGMKAQTIAQYYNPVYNQTGTAVVGYDAMEYTVVELDFSEIGTTSIADPTPYEAPEYADKLQTAMDKMKEAKNSSFTAIDTTTSAPSQDDGEYSYLDSVASGASSRAGAPGYGTGDIKNSYTPAFNYNSSIGIGAGKNGVGLVGKVTENEILLTRVSKYSYGMDDKLFRYENTGYKQIVNNGTAEDYYEEFAYNSSAVTVPNGTDTPGKYGALEGTKSIYGHVSDKLPGFDFSPNLFKSSKTTVDGKTTYTFTLQAMGATRDIAMEISMYSYAHDASSSSSRNLTIVVDDNGNMISSSYPYSITQGTYIGYVTTTYSQIGSTTISEDTFNEYVARGWKTSWDQFTIKYYQENESDPSHDENAMVAVNSIFGTSKKVPTPKDFMQIFGDEISGPFYDSKTKTNADGSEQYVRFMSITARSTKFDENSQITNFEEIMEKADNLFINELKYTKSNVLTDITGGASGRGDRYLVYDNGETTIVIENNFTKNFWVYIYNSGDYTRGGITA